MRKTKNIQGCRNLFIFLLINRKHCGSGKYFLQHKIIDLKVLPELSELTPATLRFSPLAEVRCGHFCLQTLGQASPCSSRLSCLPLLHARGHADEQNSFALDCSAHALHDPSWIPQKPGPQNLRDICKAPPVLFPFLNHPSCLIAVMDQPLCQICCPASTWLSGHRVCSLGWIFHPALL